MSKEIVINAEKSQTRIALIEDGVLVELYIEDPENERTLGDIHLGRVRRTMSSIQAAFIDIGQKQDAFLHYSDLADNLPEWLELLEQDAPSVRKSADSRPEDSSPRLARRRRPSGQRGTAGDRAATDNDVADSDDESGSEPLQKNAKGRSRVDVKTRGRRRSAQQRPKHKQEDQLQESGKQKRPPRDVHNDDDAPDTPDTQPTANEGRGANRNDSRGANRNDGRNHSRNDGRDEERDDDRDDEKGSASDNRGRKGDRGKGRGAGRNERRPTEKRAFSPESYLKRDRPILVKIVKEPISAKGSRVSTDISLAGRFLVLVPLANYVAVSKKIFSYKERRRLRALAKSLLPEGFGVIVRTVAEGKKAKELDTDLRLLLDKWNKIEKKLQGRPKPPLVVHEDVSMASSVIRDLFSDDYDRILIDEPKLHRNVKNYVQAIAPHMVEAVQLHKSKKHIFQQARIAREVQEAFESRVDLPSGGYLFIEHTEAMHVIDVNSGRAGRGLSQEDNSLKVDIEAVHVIAKQVRLRDLGGIIVVDFIDLRQEKNRKKVFNELRNVFRKDRAVTKVLPMSDFGLVEITRQRLRPSITKTFSPSAGEVSTPSEAREVPVVIENMVDERQDEQRRSERPEEAPRQIDIATFVEKVERWIQRFKERKQGRVVHLQVHPFTAAFLTRNIPTLPTRWFLKYLIRVKIRPDEKMAPFRYRFIDPQTGKPFRTERRKNKKPLKMEDTPS